MLGTKTDFATPKIVPLMEKKVYFFWMLAVFAFRKSLNSLFILDFQFFCSFLVFSVFFAVRFLLGLPGTHFY